MVSDDMFECAYSFSHISNYSILHTAVISLESFYTRGFRRITKGPDRDSYFHEVSVVQ